MNVLLQFYYFYSFISILLRNFFFNCTIEDFKEDIKDIIAIYSFCSLLELIISKYIKNLNINYELIILFTYYIYYSCSKDVWSKFISNTFLLNRKLNRKLNINFIDTECQITINNNLYRGKIYSILKYKEIYPNNKNIQMIKIELTNINEENPFDLNKLYPVVDKQINQKLEIYRSKYDFYFDKIEYEFHLIGFFKNYDVLKHYYQPFSSLFLKDSNINNDNLKYLIDDNRKFLRKIKIENSFQLSSDLISENKYIFQNINYIDIINCSLSNDDKKIYNKYDGKYWNLSLVNVNI